jgi:hypothetical protein
MSGMEPRARMVGAVTAGRSMDRRAPACLLHTAPLLAWIPFDPPRPSHSHTPTCPTLPGSLPASSYSNRASCTFGSNLSPGVPYCLDCFHRCVGFIVVLVGLVGRSVDLAVGIVSLFVKVVVMCFDSESRAGRGRPGVRIRRARSAAPAPVHTNHPPTHQTHQNTLKASPP